MFTGYAPTTTHGRYLAQEQVVWLSTVERL